MAIEAWWMLKILKIGGAVFACKDSDSPKLDEETLDRICSEIGRSLGKDKLILIHGAGSYGHPIVKRTGIGNGIKAERHLVDFAKTQRLQNELDCIVTEKLIEEGVPATPCQASSNVVMESGRISSMNLDAVKGFLEVGLVPVLYGVPAYDKDQGCSILSGDEIGPYLGKELEAEKMIHVTDVDGIFTTDPKKDPDAELIPLVTRDNLEEVRKSLGGSSSTDVTGGMYNKLEKLLVLAEEGVESVIINGLVPGRVEKALKDRDVKGTVVRF